ncbi:squalene/phytoene synthase family protein [Parvularcula lutaonensis]|uniref:Squalene/phytoene synthase family protein n=1 Tax=Parvularcula lutaonensis TaxID=491923 RepID=A0ABV7M7A4_9PROT|nr:squalene/phytoene synthase family protein [Parvularcula lutaonensis]GGY41278.1 hypothetical protein GCM10007148_07330 [Parvularcula lutaonensis]
MKPEGFSPLDPQDASYLLAQVEAFEPDWALVLPYVPDEARGGWLAVLAFAAEAIGAPGRVSNGMLGRIRLQWWREALDEVFSDGAVREHPGVGALATTLRPHVELRARLEQVIDGMEAFLSHGTDSSIEAALEVRRPVYGALAETLGALAGTPGGGDGLVLHALSRSAPDGDALPGEDGVEPPARRFSRALGRSKTLEAELAQAILSYRASRRDKELPLPALPLRLTKAQGERVIRIKNPLGQKLAILRGVLTGRA